MIYLMTSMSKIIIIINIIKVIAIIIAIIVTAIIVIIIITFIFIILVIIIIYSRNAFDKRKLPKSNRSCFVQEVPLSMPRWCAAKGFHDKYRFETPPETIPSAQMRRIHNRIWIL